MTNDDEIETESDSIIDKQGLDHEVGDVEFGVETDNPVDLGVDEPLDDEDPVINEQEHTHEDKEAIINEDTLDEKE